MNNLKGRRGWDLKKMKQVLMQEIVEVEVSGKKVIRGTVIDLGTDVIVLYNGTNFVYIPMTHIQCFRKDYNNEEYIHAPTELPMIYVDESKEDMNLAEILIQAKGKSVEMHVTDHHSLHGYITDIQQNYFSFYSPIYKTMYISTDHVKWLIPYAQNINPYGIANTLKAELLNKNLLKNTFAEQIGNLKDTLVILNAGGQREHLGKIIDVDDQIIEFQNARMSTTYFNLDHIKTIHQV